MPTHWKNLRHGGLAVLAGLSLAACSMEPATQSCQVQPVFAAPPINACAGSGRVRITLAGDVLLHGPLQQMGYAGGFPALWAQAAPFLGSADIAIVNLEGPVAPGVRRSGRQVPDPGPVYGTGVYTGYPTFNYHPMVLPDLRALGVDIVTTANNHAMDRGSRGADMTLAELDKAGIGAVGTILSGAPRNFVLRKQTRLGTLSLVACSFSTNGMPDRQRQVLMCYTDRAELLDIVRREAADPSVAAVLVLPHWGQEYTARPDARQGSLAKALVAAGATAIVGTHPHAVQPYQMVPRFDGRTVPVVYSTGNFVAGQHSMPARVGALAMLELCRASSGRGLVAGRIGWIAMQMEFTPQGFWLDIAPAGTPGPRGVAFRHLSRIAPGFSAQPLLCEETSGR